MLHVHLPRLVVAIVILLAPSAVAQSSIEVITEDASPLLRSPFCSRPTQLPFLSLANRAAYPLSRYRRSDSRPHASPPLEI